MKDVVWSKSIDFLRFPMMGGVVFIHFNLASGVAVQGEGFAQILPDWFYFIVNIISNVIASIGVPWFFVISGFLFFYNIDNLSTDVYFKKVSKRVKTLLVPFLIWNVIAILWKLKCFLPVLSDFYSPYELIITPSRLFNTFFYNGYTNGIFVNNSMINEVSSYHPIDGPLWFIRELMVMALCSPLFWILLKHRKIGLVFIISIGFLWMASEQLLNSQYLISFVTAIFFFSWGAYFSINKRNIIYAFMKKGSCLLLIYLVIAVLDASTKWSENNVYLHNVGIIIGVVSVTGVTSRLIRAGKVSVAPFLANSSFFIYAFHDLFITELGKITFILLKIPGDNPFIMTLYYFAIPIVTVIICLAIYKFLKFHAPLVCGILTGSR